MEGDDSPCPEEASPLETAFSRASKHFPSLVSGMPAEDALYFYARYKQATEGDCVGSRPGVFSVTARRKFDAWQRLGGVSATEAMREYVSGVKEQDPDWAEDVVTTTAGWARVSRMPVPADDTNASDGLGSAFLDAVRDGRVAELRAMADLAEHVTSHYGDGMTGLHWACDRGNVDVAETLLTSGACVNALDSSGQTPLHYAASCGHSRLVSLLLLRGADPGCTDQEGLTPRQVALEEVAHLL